MTTCRHLLSGGWFLLSSLYLSGCALLPGGGSEDTRLTGLLEIAEEGWSINPCGASEPLRVQADADLKRVFLTVAQPGQTAIYVDMQGRISNDTLFPTSIMRMQSSGRGCDAETDPSAHWVAAGPHPSWRLTIGDQGIAFDSEQAEDTGPTPVISEQLPDGSRSFRTQRDDRLELWLYAQDCFNHAGDFSHMTATLIVDGKRMSGCAYKGLGHPQI